MENEEINQGIPETEGDVENFVEGFDQLPDIDPPPTTQTESKGRDTTETRGLSKIVPEWMKPTELKEGYDAVTGLVDGQSDSVFRGVQAAATNFIDDTFRGDKETYDEILARQDKEYGERIVQRQKDTKELQIASGVIDEEGNRLPNVYSETLGVPIGAALGNLEAGFEIAELGGDLTRYIFNLGNVDPTQNPFSDKYQWATWDLVPIT